MKRRLVSTLLTAASCAMVPMGLALATPAAAQAVVKPRQDIAISVGRGELVAVPGRIADIFVADDKVADVQVKSLNQIYIFGKAGGETSVYASDASGNVLWSANVRVGSNIDSVQQMLGLAMPDARITVSTMGTNTALLTGTIGAPEDAAEAVRLVQAFLGDKTNVISRLKMATPLQVNLQVKFAEVSRSLVRALGTNLQTVDTTGGFKFGITTGRGATKTYVPGSPGGLGVGFTTAPEGGSLVVGNKSGSTAGFFGKLLGLDIASALDLAERNGLVTMLSQPNLTALSGETADFLAGGEFPIPMSQGLGSTSIEYKKFGVSLAYTPTVLANGRISIRVRPEVSELSTQGSVTLNGFQVPALTVRRAETTVELGSGQSFMIAGLMSNSANNTIDKTPGAGDLPILGNLFRSTEFRKGQTELVIVVTPYLVNPVNANDIKLPTDGFRAPNALQQLLGNMETDGESGASRPMPTVAPSDASGPKVGLTDEPAPKAGREKVSKKSRKPELRAQAAVAPGFSLK